MIYPPQRREVWTLEPKVTYKRRCDVLLDYLNDVTHWTPNNLKVILSRIRRCSYLKEKGKQCLIRLATLCTLFEAESKLVLAVVESVMLSHREKRMSDDDLIVFINHILANFSLQVVTANETFQDSVIRIKREQLLITCSNVFWNAIDEYQFHPKEKKQFSSKLCTTLLKTFVGSADFPLLKKATTLQVVARAMQVEDFTIEDGFDDLFPSLVQYFRDLKDNEIVDPLMIKPLFLILVHSNKICEMAGGDPILKELSEHCSEFSKIAYINRRPKMIDISGHSDEEVVKFIGEKLAPHM